MSTSTESICVLTGAAGESADDCHTHRHRIQSCDIHWLSEQLESQASTLARITGERDELRVERKLLREAISGLGWHSQNGVDVCWCHVKSGVDGYQHAEKCIRARAALNPTGEREGGE